MPSPSQLSLNPTESQNQDQDQDLQTQLKDLEEDFRLTVDALNVTIEALNSRHAKTYLENVQQEKQLISTDTVIKSYQERVADLHAEKKKLEKENERLKRNTFVLGHLARKGVEGIRRLLERVEEGLGKGTKRKLGDSDNEGEEERMGKRGRLA